LAFAIVQDHVRPDTTVLKIQKVTTTASMAGGMRPQSLRLEIVGTGVRCGGGSFWMHGQGSQRRRATNLARATLCVKQFGTLVAGQPQ